MSYLPKFDCKSARVKGLSFHPKRPWILSSLHTGLIQLWDYRSCTLIDRFEGHEGPVRGIDFHMNQPIFVSGGDDYKIKVWNYKQKKSLFTLLGHLDYIRTTFFHKEYPWILSASDDQTVRIWNWQSRTVISILSGHSHYVMCAQFHPKEDLIISASLDQTVRVWNISELRKKNVAPNSLTDLENNIRQVASVAKYSGYGSSNSGHTELFGVGDVVVRHIVEGHERGVNWATFHPTLPIFVSAADDRTVKLWRMSETKAWEIDTLRGHFNNVSSVLFHPRQDLVISDSEDKFIRVWDLAKRKCVTTIRRDSDRFWTISAHPQLNIFAAGHDTGFIVFKLDRERPAFTVHKNYLFYVQPPYLRRLDFTVAKDIPLIQLREGRTAASMLAYNPIEHMILVLGKIRDSEQSSSDSLTSNANSKQFYDLYILPRNNTDSGVEPQHADTRSGSGQAVAWVGRNKFAVLETSGSIVLKNLMNEKLKRISMPGVDTFFYAGTGYLLLRDTNGLRLYDVVNARTVSELKSTKSIRQVVWSPDGQYVAAIAKLHLHLCDRELKIKATIQETVRIKSGAWEEHGVFIYTTSNHIKYSLLNGDHGIIRTLELPVYITKVRGNSVFCLNREYAPIVLSIDPTEYCFKLALIDRRYDQVLHMVRNSNLVGQAIIGYLEKKGYPEVALHFVKDTRTRFSLAMDCGQLEVGLESALALDDKACWKRLGDLALMQGNYMILELAYQKMKSFDRLTFLYLITGKLDKLQKLLKIAEIRKDFSGHYQLALLLGAVSERVRVLQNGDQKPLAYMTAFSHGLYDEAKAISDELGASGISVGDLTSGLSSATTSLLLPSPPISNVNCEKASNTADANWPMLRVQLDYFESTITQKQSNDESAAVAVPLLGPAGVTIDVGDVDQAAWGKDAELEIDDADEFADAIDVELTGGQQPAADSKEIGWDVDDADLDILEEKDVKSMGNDPGAGFVAPLPARLPSCSWIENSCFAADHILAGNWPEAMKLLNTQVGIVAFDSMKPLILSLFAASRSMALGVPSTPSIFVYPQRNWKKHSASSTLPTVVVSLNTLINRLQMAYQLTTKGKFQEAIDHFRSILWCIPLLIVNSSTEEAEARRLLNVCKEYILGLSMELKRKSMPKDNIADQVRAVEMACYFTHCRLETPHLILTLRTAVNLLFKLKNFRTAASMAQRLLDLAPSMEVAAQTRKILQACTSSTPFEDAHSLHYDPRNPFEICAGTYVPIYRGKPHVKDPLTGAFYVPSMKGQLCHITKVTEIGLECEGLRIHSGKHTR